eukprot:TRINITY_DN2908_c0_g1_i1.p2 TRINITY_DN2908_c0_g1~~TRINITY_DN2908_c0_g1_i1.p2  ORF type:complete len:314 (+),score=129.06 TRINITY_DN2908_c0_g1_i1:56-943(+)
MVAQMVLELFDGQYEVLAGALVATNLLWVVIAFFLSNRGAPRGLRGKFSDQDWQLAQDQADAQIVTKEGGRHTHGTEQFIPYAKYKRYSTEQMAQRAADFYKLVDARRTVRDYSSESFPISVLEDCIRAAGTAPSGANLAPWTYVIVKDADVKSQIRQIVEDEEAVNYARRMKESWKEDLAHLGTDANKPYLEEAPYLVCVFKHAYRIEDGERLAVYYPEQSTGISVGMFQTAVHNAGLVTLTSTPMGAEAPLRELLGRPENERLSLLMPVGYPKDNVQVPNISRKPLDEIRATV